MTFLSACGTIFAKYPPGGDILFCGAAAIERGGFPMNTKNTATLFAILAAVLYAINIPLSKMLLTQVEPTMMAAFLYLGAGGGLFL